MSNALKTIVEKIPKPTPASNDWLQRLKSSAFKHISDRDLPSPKEESWKYTSLHLIKKTDYVLAETIDSREPSETIYSKTDFSEDEKIYLVFINGFFRKDLSSNEILKDGINIHPIKVNNHDDQENLEKIIESDLNETFSALNILSLCDGLLIDIGTNQKIEKIINIVFISESTQPLLKSLRIVVRLNENSEARVIEEYRSSPGDLGLTTVVTNIRLGKDSILHHHRLQNECVGTANIGKIDAQVAAGASFFSDSIAMGGGLNRVDIDVSLVGKAAYCRLNGLFTGVDEQHVDHHTTIRHQVGDTHSDELYRGILDGKSRGVFNGKVIVSPDAQKISARQASNNLLLSKLAEIDTKPELQIYADDVICAHGATVGQLDETALFYLRSRGISREDAKALLIYAFAEKVIESIPLPTLRQSLEKKFLGHNKMSEFIQKG